MKNSRIFSRIKKPFFYASFVLAMACAGGDDDGSYTGFFQPETSISSIAFRDYHFSPSFVYGSGESYQNFYSDSVLYAKDDNLESWMQYIGGNYTIQEAGQAIYRRNKLSYWIDEKKKLPLSTVFLDAIKQHPAAWKYLQFAWKIEDAQTQITSWYEESKKKDSLALVRYLPQTENFAKKEQDPFLKERYAFQAMKICGELHKYQNEIKLF